MQFTQSSIGDTLIEYVSEELLSGQTRVGPDDNLLSEGMVDSLGMLRLVGFIEESFGVKVPPQDFVIENFRSVGVLSDYLQRRLADAGQVSSDA